MTVITQARGMMDAAHRLVDYWRTRIRGDPLSPWDPNIKLVDLTGQADWLTLGECCSGICCFGANGSGKTSSLATIAVTLMELQCGFVWMCAKPDELQLVKRLAKHAGRLDDVIVIGEEEDGRITPHRFNPLDYECSLPQAGTSTVVHYLADCNKVLSRQEAARAEGDSRFWDTQFERLLRYCIDTGKLAGRPLSVDLLRRIQLSAPLTADQLKNKDWLAQSTCWQCLGEAERRLEQGEIAEEDFDRIASFWTADYFQLDQKPRATIDVMFAALVDSFYAEEPLRSILTTTTTVTPEDVTEDGKIVVLSLPTSVYHEAGRMAQFCFKYSFQRAMLRRRKPADGSFLRPCILWTDEAHNFSHRFDERYFAEVRSNRGINVFLEQGIGGYMNALGVNSPKQVDNYLTNLATKFFFQNGSPETNDFAAETIGKMMMEEESETISHSPDGGSTSTTRHKQERYQVLSGEFIQLRRGGQANNRQVDFIVAKAGGVFNQTGSNWAKHYFTQTELTR